VLVIARGISHRQDEVADCRNLGLLLEQQGELRRVVELMPVRVDFLLSSSLQIHPNNKEC